MYIAQNTTKRIAVVFLTCLPQKYRLSKKLQQIIQRCEPQRSDVNNNNEHAMHYYETHPLIGISQQYGLTTKCQNVLSDSVFRCKT